MADNLDQLVNELVNDVLTQAGEYSELGLNREKAGAHPIVNENWQSETTGAFVEHDLPLKGNEVVQGWAIPLCLDRADLDPRKWRSEHQAMFVGDALTVTATVAGNKSAPDANAPAFFAWSFPEHEEGGKSSRSKDGDEFVPGLSTTTAASGSAPFGLNGNQTGRDWQSEYNAASHSAQSSSVPSVVAGVASDARDPPPPFFFWPVSDQRLARKKSVPLIQGTEHADRFSWPIDETSPTLAPIPHVKGKAGGVKTMSKAPFGVWGTVDLASWASEYKSRYVKESAATARACKNVLSPPIEFHYELTVEELEAAKREFHCIDIDGNHSLSAAELGLFYERQFGERLLPEEIQDMLNEADVQQMDGHIQLSEFLEVCARAKRRDSSIKWQNVYRCVESLASSSSPRSPRQLMPPPPPSAGKKVTELTESKASYSWPKRAGGKGNQAKSSRVVVGVPSVGGGRGGGEGARLRSQNSNQHTISRDSYKWPVDHVRVATVKKSSNASSPDLLAHSVRPPLVRLAEIDAALALQAEDPTGIQSTDSLAATAQATALDTIETPGGALDNASSAPASSVTGPTGDAVVESKARGIINRGPKLAVLGTKIKIQPTADATRAATTKTTRRPNAAAQIFKAIKGRSPANPVLHNRRYPSTSDKQNGRWLTESKAAFSVPDGKALWTHKLTNIYNNDIHFELLHPYTTLRLAGKGAAHNGKALNCPAVI